MLSMGFQIVFPVTAFALTTGPSQPEFQAFEPVGTTDMVDLFTGDFVYNIPLLDVEGYPVNISYHGGIGMEQEASWVGLGWNINPGEINRTVRGIPDDFKGDSIKKQVHIKPENNLRVGVAGGAEFFGIGDPLASLSLELGANLNFSNYKGVSADFSFGTSIRVMGAFSAGINMGVGSQTGAGIDYNAGLRWKSSNIISNEESGMGLSVGSGYSTRTGLKDISLSLNRTTQSLEKSTRNSQVTVASAVIPIGTQNYVPVITNASTMVSIEGRIKLGPEVLWSNVYGNIKASLSRLKFDEEASRKSYGYLFSEEATDHDIHDFTRDKDGSFNKNMSNLPPGNMTYDIYSVSGQGTGGMFRPFRNDFGSVYDPRTNSEGAGASVALEASLGWLFAFGGDANGYFSESSSGPWSKYKRNYAKQDKETFFEKTYFKQGGELTAVHPAYFNVIGQTGLLHANGVQGLPHVKPGERDPRANYIYYFDAAEASIPGIASHNKIYSYASTNGFASGPAIDRDSFPRFENDIYKRKSYHISEVTQMQKDGRRYIYGVAAMNHIQKEATFAVNAGKVNKETGMVKYNSGQDDTKTNKEGLDHYYSGTITPAYAHSYLLTSVLSADYRDITGDGPTDDDLGSYTKFNYTLKEEDYRWRAPYQRDSAQYNPGFWSDARDDKGSYVTGSREQWILHSIESKNYLAEFYTSRRHDGRGATARISNNTGSSLYDSDLTEAAYSYRLDSIKLFNKHDRFLNKTQATPIKTVYFSYSYDLCKNVPNNLNNVSTGKLTLEKIYIKWGNSDRSMLSPYQFDYAKHDNSCNPDYNQALKDRWGGYKPKTNGLSNYEFPFVNQSDPDGDKNAAVWSLRKIYLPSGGRIEVNYEADDYAYVQDKEAMEMFLIQGLGNSKTYHPGSSQLFYDKNTPYLYAYFKRRPDRELAGRSFKDNYLKNLNYVYYNFNVSIYGGKYEAIKGYAEIEDVGISNDSMGYVKFKGVAPIGGGAFLHPASYTAVNLGRYYLPHIIYPGTDPETSGLNNILAGLKQAFSDLISIGQNPVVNLISSGRGQYIDASKSYIRLDNPGLSKRGGGHRVKSLLFYDSWEKMTGNNNQDATYGKEYDYTIEDGSDKISSGVASYEPMVGGDENPSRVPYKYEAQSGGHFPPHDPVALYQETPFGESLFPAPVVGYSRVTVRSIHNNSARSAKAYDVNEFYTARDYPITVAFTGLENKVDETIYKFFEQVNTFEATQGYTITLNDMHGKPKGMYRYVKKPKGPGSELISYQTYEYYAKGGKLDNTVPIARYNGSTIVKEEARLGIEADVTIDTREKKEHATNATFNMNLNTTNILFAVIPIPWAFGWKTEHKNEFRSAVVTKVIQQYGILKSIESFNEGAVTKVSNEVFDPLTGQAVVTSVNNEFKDKIYNTTYPAYWGYKGMGPAYANTGFEGSIDTVKIDKYQGVINTSPELTPALRIGDELFISYLDSTGTERNAIAWIQDFRVVHVPEPMNITHCCLLGMMPRYPNNTPGWPLNGHITRVNYKVIRSGCKNMLHESIQQYSGFDNPFDDNNLLKPTLENLISLSAKTFSSDNSTLEAYLPDSNNVSLNKFLNGRHGIYRLTSEYAYVTPRIYPGLTRTSGLFSALSLWTSFIGTEPCMRNDVKPVCSTVYLSISAPYLTLNYTDLNWREARHITKYSPYGFEVENRDALGIYTAAIYGYNNQLPVAVAQNANFGEVLAEGFEDYSLLQLIANWMAFEYSPFQQLFSSTALSGTPYKTYNGTGTEGVQLIKNVSHTGYYCLKIPGSETSGSLEVPLNTTPALSTIEAKKSYQSFTLQKNKQYLVSFWIKTQAPTLPNSYHVSSAGVYDGTATIIAAPKTNLIDGWQQFSCVFKAGDNPKLLLPRGYYVDDIRLFPLNANMKSFVYHPQNQRVMAMLDENNFATFYEYDQEGNLIRTKKETERGILTVTESRSVHPGALNQAP